MVLVLIRRDLKKESSAFIWFTLCPDITLMPFNDFWAQVQPNSKSRNLLGLLILDPVKTIKKFIHIRLFNSSARVANAYDGYVVIGTAIDDNGFIFCTIFNGIT